MLYIQKIINFNLKVAPLLKTSRHPLCWKKIDSLIGDVGINYQSAIVVVNFTFRDVIQKEVKYAWHEHLCVK